MPFPGEQFRFSEECLRGQCAELLLFFVGYEFVGECADGGADDGGDPEEPELAQGPAADEDRDAGAAGGVDAGVGDGDADQVDEG